MNNANNTEIDWKKRALAAEERLEWLALCASDIVSMWPRFSLRMVGSMSKSVDALKDALK